MMDALHVVGSEVGATLPCLLMFDEYVPLRFRTSDDGLVRYVQLGNNRTTLFELKVHSKTHLIRAATVTLYVEQAPWPDIIIVAEENGLPVISDAITEPWCINLEQDFSTACREGEVIVFWGNLQQCKSYTFANQVHFLTENDRLVGIWFTGLEPWQLEMFASCATSARKLATTPAMPGPK